MLFIVVLICFFGSLQADNTYEPGRSYITYQFSGGRLGDQLTCYLHAKWLSYVYDMPVLYIPFRNSDKFAFHNLEIQFKRFPLKKVLIHTGHELTGQQKAGKLFVLPFYPDSIYEYQLLHLPCPYIAVNWNDPIFRAEVRRMLQPTIPVPKISLPEGRIPVAVHVRTGENFDSTIDHRVFPLKFPPQEFYIEQVKKIDELLGGQPLYVFIFTDAANPEAVLSEFEKSLNHLTHIQFDCRRKPTDILEDFFAISQFKCLVRGQSHFSIIASKLGNMMIEIEPIRFHWERSKKVIDEVLITYDECVE